MNYVNAGHLHLEMRVISYLIWIYREVYKWYVDEVHPCTGIAKQKKGLMTFT